MNSYSQIKIGAYVSYFSVFINIILTLVYMPWLIKEIGNENYGLYSLAVSLIGLFLMDFGLGASASRYISKYIAEGNREAVKITLGTSFVIYLLIDLIFLIISLIVFFNIDAVYQKLTVEELDLLKVLFIIVVAFNVISLPASIQNSILTSYEKFIQLKICDLSRRLLTIVLVVYSLFRGWGVISLVIANALSGLLIIIVKSWIIKTQIGVKMVVVIKNNGLFKSILSFSGWITVISIAQKFIYNISSSILGAVSGSLSIAIYSPASALGSYYYVLAEAINGLFLPKISRLVAQNKDNEISQLMVKVGKIQSLILGGVFFVFICVGDDFFDLWLGSSFHDSYYCALLIFFPALFEYSQQIGKTTLIVRNFVKIYSIGYVVISCIGLLLAVVFASFWGAIGVSMSVCFSGIFNVIFQNILFKKKLALDVSLYFKKVIFPFILIFVLSLLISFFVISFFKNYNCWCFFLLKTLCASLIYLLFFGIFFFTKTDIMNLVKLKP